MGTVYKAIDQNLERLVAVKVMHTSSEDEVGRARFLREAAAIASLDHPGILRVFSYGEFESRPFFVMDYIEGCSIKEFVTRCKAIHQSGMSPDELMSSGYIRESKPETPFFLSDPIINPVKNPEYPFLVRKLMTSAALALGDAHAHEIVHRDIKSSNILIVDDQKIKLIDFGLVKQRGNLDLTQTDHFMGTLSYAAPEQLMGRRGNISARTDIYCLGVVFYELLTLAHPISEEDPAAIVSSISQGSPVSPRVLNPHISPELEEIVLKCLEKDPGKRFRDGNELAGALNRLSQSGTWFSGFKEMLKGWFLKEGKQPSLVRKPDVENQKEESQGSNRPVDSSKQAARKFLKEARQKFYINFSVIEAIDALKQAYKLDPSSADILFMLSFALNAIGHHSEIKEYLDSSEKLLDKSSRQDKEKYLLIRDLFWTRNYEEGRQRAIRLQEAFPDDIDFQFALFFSLEAVGDYSSAVKVGKNMAGKLPDNNILAVAQSECYFSIMDFENAQNILKDRILKYPDYNNLHLKSIQTLLISGKFEEAEREVKHAVSKDPQNMLMLFYLARVQSCSGKFDEAYEIFRKAVGMPGDIGLRATGYYCLYRIKELMGYSEVAKRHLEQARRLKEIPGYLSNDQALKIIESELLDGIEDELSNKAWRKVAIKYAIKVSYDSIDIRAYTIGNPGCTSIFEVSKSGKVGHHCIYSNFNLFDGEEVITQVWLPEFPESPFIDQAGNILPFEFYKSDGPVKGGVASVRLVEGWKPNQSIHMHCKLADFELIGKNGKTCLQFPDKAFPTCRREAFLVILPENLKIVNSDIEPEEELVQNGERIYAFFPYLAAGELFNPTFEIV